MKIKGRYINDSLIMVAAVTVFFCFYQISLYIKIDVSQKFLYDVIDSFSKKFSSKDTTSVDIKYQHIKEFYNYIENPTRNCSHPIYLGGDPNILDKFSRDGDKVVCFDKEFDIKTENCLVYSFGINNEWSFDDAIAKFGCKVNAFDPTIGVADHKRGDRIYFYNIGLSDKDDEIMIRRKRCKVRRFTTILKQLGDLRNDLVIDYLKVDVEGSEIPFLEDMLQNSQHILKKVKQIGIEIHLGSYNLEKEKLFQLNYKILKQLENIGFQLFSSRFCANEADLEFLSEAGRKVCGFYELVYGLWPAQP